MRGKIPDGGGKATAWGGWRGQQLHDAAERGIAVGNVITSVNLKAVRTPAEVAAAVEAARKAGRPTILLSVLFRGQLASVPVKVN